MSIKIDHNRAEEIILQAFKGTCTKKDEITESIKNVLYGNHKTYKYILVTGILAKATSEKANPIVLQVGSSLSGSYDARSLCHKVLVPFERNLLNNVLGGSNEPFLNKPARFKELSANNAVRKGADKDTLLLIIDLFSKIYSSKDAKEYLACVFFHLQNRIKEQQSIYSNITEYNPTLIEIYEFSIAFLKKSYEGETSAIVVGAFEYLYHKTHNKRFQVITHKVNQSGASSKEIGDIDVYNGGSYYYSIEVKDKNFNQYDVDHALNKVLKNNGKKAAFIYGIDAAFNKKSVLSTIEEYEKKGVFVLFLDIRTHIKNTLFRLPTCTKQDFINGIINTSQEINCKEETKVWIKDNTSKLGW